MRNMDYKYIMFPRERRNTKYEKKRNRMQNLELKHIESVDSQRSRNTRI